MSKSNIHSPFNACQHREHCQAVKAQRDELLTICEELAACAAYWSEYDVPLGIVDRLNAAIAKAKEGEK